MIVQMVRYNAWWWVPNGRAIYYLLKKHPIYRKRQGKFRPPRWRWRIANVEHIFHSSISVGNLDRVSKHFLYFVPFAVVALVPNYHQSPTVLACLWLNTTNTPTIKRGMERGPWQGIARLKTNWPIGETLNYSKGSLIWRKALTRGFGNQLLKPKKWKQTQRRHRFRRANLTKILSAIKF